VRCLLFILALACGLSFAQSIPMDEDSFTKIAVERLAKELSEYNLKPAGKLTIEGKRADGESTGQVSLDRVYAYCVRNAQSCAAAMDQFSKGIAESIKERDRPIDPSMVRLVVRPSAYAEQIRKQMTSSGGTIYFKDVAPSLIAIPVLDFARSVRYVNDKDLVKLTLSEDQLFQLGMQNLRSQSRQFSEVAPVPKANSLGYIDGEDYASSRILFHDDWKILNSKLNNKLVVSLPAPNTLLYGDGSTSAGVDALRTLAADVARKSDRPLSLTLLQWTESGWELVK
jgi:uncharacterized protein YtpQ (UPF0354 family)